jgi:hypothetical protein
MIPTTHLAHLCAAESPPLAIQRKGKPMPEPFTIPLDFPNSDYAVALAQLVKRLDYETVRRFADKNVTYGGHAECDVMWSALRGMEHQFAEAGFAPR